MKYVEFTVETTPEAEDLVAEIFLRYVDFGVSIKSDADVREIVETRKDTFDYINDELLTETTGKSFVKGSFPLNTAKRDFLKVQNDLDSLKTSLKGILDVGTLAVTERVFENDDWIKNWREHFKPITFDKLCVCPSWIECETEKQKVIIGTDLAFGTGEHETTSMCIKLLERFVKEGDVVADIGTGSGILGICAAKLGAKKVVMTDNDPSAVKACEENVKLNDVYDKCFPYLADLLEGREVKANVAVANITAEILIRLSETIKDFLLCGGTLIMSGILNAKVGAVKNAFLKNGFEYLETICENEWSAVVMRKLR